MARVILNRINISTKINSVLSSKKFAGLARNAANTKFVFAKNNMLEEFESHEITKEIRAGAEAESQFLLRGNITSFIGLEDGNQSIAELRNILETRTKMLITPDIIRNKNGITYAFKIKQPTLQEIYDETVSPWATKSWVAQIQDGLSNFIYYLYSKSGRFAQWSRSGTGLQSNYKRKSGGRNKVLGIKWINEIISNFRARFK